MKNDAAFASNPYDGGYGVISSIAPCDGVGAGANPVGHPNFDGPKFAGYRSKPKGWLLTVREPPDESSVSRVRVPLAKPRICGATCPSDHPVVQLRENTRVQSGRCGFDSHRECQFRRAVEFGLSARVLTDQRVQIPPQPPIWLGSQLPSCPSQSVGAQAPAWAD